MRSDESLDIVAADGTRLRASVFEPDSQPTSVIVFNPAMGVPRRVYSEFARWFAERGVAVLIYDYRGMGGSAPRSLRGFKASIVDWARLDLPAAVSAAQARYAGAPIALCGHSIGGQLFGLSPAAPRAAALVGIAAQSGYWGHWRGIEKIGIWTLWHVLIPVLTTLFGYFPSRAVGLGQSLPRDAALQWARWGRHPLYLRNPSSGPRDQFFNDLEVPLLSIGLERDRFAPPAAVATFRKWFPRAPLTTIDIPAREGVGHFGFFRREQGESYWQLLREWLEGTLGAVPAPQSGGRAARVPAL